MVGSVGPGTKLPSLGNIAYDPLEAALAAQCRGLIAGGVDAILIETCQDTLQIKAAVNGAKIARAEAGTDTPIFVQVTVETTGTLLVGPDIAAAATVIARAGRAADGAELRHRPAGDGRACRLARRELARPDLRPAQCRLAGTGGRPHPLSAVRGRDGDLGGAIRRRGRGEPGRRLLRHLHAAYRRAGRDAAKRRRRLPAGAGAAQPVWVPSVASLYQPVRCGRRTAIFSIGERCNANGSKKWRELQEAHDWDGCVAMGREQIAEGSNALDICTAFVGRDEMAEMNEVVPRFTASVNAPLVIDCTETPVIEAALKLHGGKPIINSINFEDGEERRHRPAEAGEEIRRRGDRADHRRSRVWRRRPRTSCASRAGWSISPATSTACRNPTC